MKIAICQINPTVGAINENVRLIKKFYNDSLKKGAGLVVFPELAISGYPPQDLLLRQKFLQKCDEALNEIINEFGLDQIRFFLFREVPFGNDGDLLDNIKESIPKEGYEDNVVELFPKKDGDDSDTIH